MNYHKLIDAPHRLVASLISPFYREFPYRGNLIFIRADARGAISEDDSFFYNRVPKAANSTVLTTLQIHSAKQNSKSITVGPRAYFTRPVKLSNPAMKQFNNEYFKFTFVRNPYSRTLSAYLDKIGVGKGHIWKRWAEKNHAKYVPTFPEFCKYLQGPGLYHDAHWAPQTDCMLIPISSFDKIGKVENLHEDLNAILRRVFPDHPTEITTAGVRKTDARSKLEKYYDAESIEIVKQIFDMDFKNFGYSHNFSDAF